MNETPGHPDASVPDEATFETRIYHGRCGRIVFTVQADTPKQAKALAKVCGSAMEGAVYRVFRDRLQRR